MDSKHGEVKESWYNQKILFGIQWGNWKKPWRCLNQDNILRDLNCSPKIFQ
jgi:hypothetical protein